MTSIHGLSPNQWGLLFLGQVLPQAPLYDVMWHCPLEGPLDPGLVRHAVAAVARRHGALRTRFDLSGIGTGAGARQLIDDQVRVDFQVVDWERVGDRDAALRELQDELAAVSFDPTRGPLFRVRLAGVSAAQHLLLFHAHHLIFDGWSVGVFLADLARSYCDLLDQGEGRLPAPTMEYSDYVALQAADLPETLQRQLPFWRDQLTGAPAVLGLPSDKPRPPVPTYQGGELELVLPEALRSRLRESARKHRTTLFTVLIAAFQAQLSRYTGHPDIVVGCPVGARTHPAAKDMIGYFINMTVLRSHVPPELTTAELVAQVRGGVLDLMEHRDVPFDAVVSELKPPRSLAWNPIFQVLFSYEEDFAEPVTLGEVRAGTVTSTQTFGAKFDLTLTVRDTRDQFGLHLEYATDLFDARSAAALVADYHRVLEAFAAGGVVVADLPVSWRPASPPERIETALETGTAYVAPRTDLERCLVGIWSAALGIEGIGVEDDFFRLGGNSLAVSQVIARIGAELEIDVSVRELFTHSTIAALAAHLATLAGPGSAARPGPVRPSRRQRLGDLISADNAAEVS